MTMTAEQLEELRRLICRAKDFAEQAKGHDAPLFEAELVKMADAMDSLMRRVIAAEKLVEALEELPLGDGPLAQLVTAYREASK